MQELINKFMVSSPWIWVLATIIIATVITIIIPKIYKEVLHTFYGIKYFNYYQQKLSYYLALQDFKESSIKNLKTTQNKEQQNGKQS